MVSSFSSGSGNSPTNLKKNKKIQSSSGQQTISSATAPLLLNSDVWFQKMRTIFFVEFTKYFESCGFLRLNDEINSNKANSTSENVTHHCKSLIN